MTGIDRGGQGAPQAGPNQWFSRAAVTSLHTFSSYSPTVLEAPEEIVSLSFPASDGCRILKGFFSLFLILIGG